MTSQIPACRECKHFTENALPEFSACARHQYEIVDYLNGKVNTDNFTALTSRERETLCGREGKNFEMREFVEEEEYISFWEYFKGFFTKPWMFE